MDSSVSHVADLFNEIVFPSSWSQHIIHPIHKLWDISYPNTRLSWLDVHLPSYMPVFQEQEAGVLAQLGIDAMYPVKGLGSISFQMPLGDVLELYFVLYVPWLTKTFLLVSCIIDLQSLDEFDC